MPRQVALTKFVRGTITIEPADGAGMPVRLIVPVTRMDDLGEVRIPGTAVFYAEAPPDPRMAVGEGHFVLPPQVATQLNDLVGKLDAYLQRLIEPKPAPARGEDDGKPKTATAGKGKPKVSTEPEDVEAHNRAQAGR